MAINKVLCLKDPIFSLARSRYYQLYILCSKQHIQICCIENNTKQCILLRCYAITDDVLSDLNELYIYDSILQHKYWLKIKIGFNNALFTILPNTFFSEKKIYTTLNISSPLDRNIHNAYYFVHKKQEVCIPFAISKKLDEFFVQKYGNNLLYVHILNIFLAHTFYHSKRKYTTNLYIFLGLDYFGIVVIKNNTLYFCNLFLCGHQVEKQVYYLQCVVQLLALKRFGIYCHGFVNKKSFFYIKVKEYFRRVHIRNQINFVGLSKNFLYQHAYQFVDIFSMSLL